MENNFANGYVTLSIEAYNKLVMEKNELQHTLDSLFRVRESHWGNNYNIELIANDELLYPMAVNKALSSLQFKGHPYELVPIKNFYANDITVARYTEPETPVEEPTDNPE
jgi:hypothetical protein